MKKHVSEISTLSESEALSLMYKNARVDEHRGFKDAFTDDQILELWESPYVQENWSAITRRWLDLVAGDILDAKLNITRE
jgi:hypothetical protein